MPKSGKRVPKLCIQEKLRLLTFRSLVILLTFSSSLNYAGGSTNIQQKIKCPFVMCIGSSIIDYIAFASEEWLLTTGAEKGGVLSVSQDQLMSMFDSLDVHLERAGGSAGTVAKGLASLGAPTGFLSRAGSDPEGHNFLKTMQEYGIETEIQCHEGQTARVAVVITPDKERTFFYYGSDNGIPQIEDIRSDVFDKTSHIHIEGYTLRNKKFLEHVIQAAKQNDISISLDLGSFVLVKEYSEYLKTLILPNIDILFGNLQEMKALFDTEEDLISTLQQDSFLAIVFKGAEGCTIYTTQEITQSPAYPVEVLDSTGGSDLFISGFLFGHLIRMWPIEKSAMLGNYLGGSIVSCLGAELSKEKWTEVFKKIDIDF